ncbi:ATP12 family chaperone protein [Novosphingobium mangrovi (ex Huang et al. 2023)]|uniref:Molecular chaperone n=1 Tax=Novosphingobium mangrovi (ex Huang et al. 2023) TaxID=2976432 RepID=A0ABT2I4F9_9SPHN|nr:ATP12 family protein [Novosphingobium mangrovi (ex Huang et al. 2023)]MCT2399698.1 molecular chaperone [Novosphingobium mangrovi (ex Huang et al. 2023)]
MKRFYKDVTVDQTDGGWRVLLDGRGIKTAGGRAQVVPSKALAEELAAEWAGQGEEIDPAAFHFRDLADFAIDAVTPDRTKVIADLLPYAETDTLCYRADPDEALYQRQLEVWEPLLASIEERLGVRFTRISGILHKPQPEVTLARLRQEIEAESNFALAALKMLASLAASLTIATEAIRPGADAEALWKAAELESDWQIELWGEDWEAAERRTARFEAFTLAMRMAELSRAE